MTYCCPKHAVITNLPYNLTAISSTLSWHWHFLRKIGFRRVLNLCLCPKILQRNSTATWDEAIWVPEEVLSQWVFLSTLSVRLSILSDVQLIYSRCMDCSQDDILRWAPLNATKIRLANLLHERPMSSGKKVPQAKVLELNPHLGVIN